MRLEILAKVTLQPQATLVSHVLTFTVAVPAQTFNSRLVEAPLARLFAGFGVLPITRLATVSITTRAVVPSTQFIGRH